MAKEANQAFSDHLKAIGAAGMHSSYKQNPQGTAALSLAQSVASQFLDSGLLESLPPAILADQYNRIEDNKRTLGHEVGLLHAYAKAIADLADRMKEEPPDAQNRQNNQDHLAALSKRFLDTAAPFLSAYQNRTLESTRKNLDKLLKEIRDARDETIGIRNTAKEAAGEIGAGHHASTFADLAERYRKRASGSLAVTVVMAVVLLAAVSVVFCLALKLTDLDHVQMIQIGIAKLVGLSVLYFLLVLAARAYKANAHLYSVNQHRASALTSFEAFVKSAADDQTKSAVLLEATRCIYTHVPSGYLGAEAASSPVQLIEVLKAASSE